MESKDLRTIVTLKGGVSAQILRRASLAQDDIGVTLRRILQRVCDRYLSGGSLTLPYKVTNGRKIVIIL